MLIYLLPPSEGKNIWGIDTISQRTFVFDLPKKIASHATPKDLKCKDPRYTEGLTMNKHIETSLVLPAIHRYDGVMYKAIWYDSLSPDGTKYFNNHVLIVSGMYGLLRPQDTIANYKLPIDTKGLKKWWWDRITQALIEMYIDQDVTFIDLLSGAYQKMLDPQIIREAGLRYITIDFLRPDGSKYAHGVKKTKGKQLNVWCTHSIDSLLDIGWTALGDAILLEV